VPRLRPGVAEAERPTGLIERPLELGAAIGEHPPQPPSGAPIQRHPDLAQEVSGRQGVVGRKQPRHAVGVRSIAGPDRQTDTAGAILVIKALGVEPGKKAIVPSFTLRSSPQPRAALFSGHP
jgi:hypothetical protein